MILFLNGSINAGKSTVAKLLVEKLPNTALLEIDTLRDMIGWMPISESIPINLENAVSIIKNFAAKGLNVIVPYPLSQKNYNYIIGELEDLKKEIHIFTLAPTLEKALTNRGIRELEDSEKDRIRYHYEIGIHKPSFGKIIDNSEQSPEETAHYIINNL